MHVGINVQNECAYKVLPLQIPAEMMQI